MNEVTSPGGKVRLFVETPLEEGLRRELEEWRKVRLSANAQEGLTAFFEKRTPSYT